VEIAKQPGHFRTTPPFLLALSSPVSKMDQFGSNNIVLVIDNNRDNCELTALILRDEGYSVKTADTAGEGLLVYHRYHPFIIITDFGMPDMNGGQLIQNLREDGEKVPIIIVSAYSKQDIEQLIHPQFPPHAILQKPVDFDLLLDIVMEHYHHQSPCNLSLAGLTPSECTPTARERS
jgi:CheY-like chemotaxis protein